MSKQDLSNPKKISINTAGISLVVSIIALAISGFNFYLSVRPGKIRIYPPSRIGYARTTKPIHSHGGDKIVISFVIHNDGNKTRAFLSSALQIKKVGEKQTATFNAAGMFEQLKDITQFTEVNLENNDKYRYYLITAIPLGKNEYYPASFLYLNKDFKLENNTKYIAKQTVVFSDGSQSQTGEQCFKFEVTNLNQPDILLSNKWSDENKVTVKDCQDF